MIQRHNGWVWRGVVVVAATPPLVAGLLLLPIFSFIFSFLLCFALVVEWSFLCWHRGIQSAQRLHASEKFFYLLWIWGCVYIIVPFFVLIGLFRSFLTATILITLAISWATDISAYGVGTWLQGPRLCPKISPHKTWSGAFGGVLGTLCLAFFSPLQTIAEVVHESLAYKPVFIFFLFLGSVVAMWGDGLQSWAKRCLHVKDSGWWIPGHGGFLDRFDAVVSVLYYCLIWLLLSFL